MSEDPDLALLLDTVDHFAAKADQRLFAEESPDGDLAAVGDLLLDAASIGLLAARRIAELHGGRIEVSAPDEGGCRLRLELPCEALA